MRIEDKKTILNLNKQIDKLHQSIKELTVITDETLDTTVELTKHIISLQEDFITVLNRLNEVELSIEATPSSKKLFVSPVKDFNEGIDTPYPKKTKRYRKSSKIQRVVTNLKRLIRNHATT